MAHKHHPDKSSGDDKKFKELNEAYEILYDDKKRAEYDTYGKTFGGNGGGGAGASGQGFGDFDFGDFASKTAKGLNLISGIFLKTFSADKEAEGQERKEARTSQ